MCAPRMLLFHVCVLLSLVLAQSLLSGRGLEMTSGQGNSYHRVGLESTDAWLMSSPDHAGIRGVKASVPGSQFTALRQAGLIGDPLYRDNDVKLQWVGNASWTYTRNFTASDDVTTANTVLLVCEGLDTLATLSVNSRSLAGMPDNMFTRYTFDVTHLIKKGDNTITVQFKSAVKEAERLASQSSYMIPPNCPPDVQRGQCFVNQVRKEQCSFSWDWGPSMPTAGIWRQIFLEAFDRAILRQVAVLPEKVNGNWQLLVDATFNLSGNAPVKGQLKIAAENLGLDVTKTVTVTPAESRVKVVVKIDPHLKIDLWWPNGYGNQTLFQVNVTFQAGSDLSVRSQRVGFRTVEVVQVPVSKNISQGLTFYFKVNGLPVFLKGSNWIPADNFQEKITEGRLRYLLTSARDVGINSMRVWGGGVYESGEFYNLCDELGIMVWQDLMFSVAFYPTYPHFLASVAEEIKQNVHRLKHHPSIMLWAGNNENEKALRQDWFHVKQNFSTYYKDYVTLYVTTIKPVVNSEDPSRQYLTSSPGNALDSEREGYVAKDPGSELYGDIHFYNYTTDQWDDAAFRIPRMATEYGIQSWCNNESLARVFDHQDFDMAGHMADHRQHHDPGNVQMEEEVTMHVKLPRSSDPAVKFANFIYLTQINQAMSMRVQTEHYRRHQAKLLQDGRGLTMGALYWQLNDIWQAPTWASIDFEGRWKMLHYYAAKFFQSPLVSPYLSPDRQTLEVYIVLDTLPSVERRDQISGELRFEPMFDLDDLKDSEITTSDPHSIARKIKEATSGVLTLTVYSYASFTPLLQRKINYSANLTAQSIYTASVLDLLESANCPSPADCFLTFETAPLISETAPFFNLPARSSNWLLLTYPKDSNLHPADVKITKITQISDGVYDITVTSSAPALFVWLSASEVVGRFSDNGFLQVTPYHMVTFTCDVTMSSAQLMAQLSVKSLTEI